MPADVDEHAGRAAAGEIKGQRGAASFIPADLADVAPVRSLIDRSVETWGPIAGLVNYAAITRSLDFFDVDPDGWRRLFDVNARGSFFAMQHAARSMRAAGGGSIVNIANIAGKGWAGASNIAYANVISGVHRASDGVVTFRGTDITRMKPHTISR
ncbi:SDR family NAD(P)-dependent oxidoreductase, partial [Aeromicrobium sp.]|uniref:SDR family NAD(P)-dependent oxidoreductase n=1 Tax=Aeromicrobium sp. TaxID=1871063 RepID=UPI0019996877